MQSSLGDPSGTATPPTVSLWFTLEDGPGALEGALHEFKRLGLSLTHIQSRPSSTFKWEVDFMVTLAVAEPSTLKQLQANLTKVAKNIRVIGSSGVATETDVGSVPWFPRRMRDLDGLAEKTLEFGAELSADHPGFKDTAYRARRAEITAIARTFRTGQQIPRIAYTDQEKETWRTVYTKVTSLYPTHACREHSYIFPLLEQNCAYSADNIPQLQDISDFLKECTGFTLRPVMGLLSSRDFLAGLAFRVFHSTQYVRHHSQPLYTPEPDICHELLGHVPLFADPDFAAFSQEIGLCSLGASDRDIERLATIYWFTVEFGLCKQDGQVRAYGAGLLSSFGELEYCLTDKPERIPFDPERAASQPYPITEYQPAYFVADSFADAQERIREFSATLDRPFGVRYNPYTQTIEVLDNKSKIVRFAASISTEMRTLQTALAKL